MANVVFKTGNSTVTIYFNDVSAASTVKTAKWRYDAIASVFLLHANAAVVVRTHNKDFPFSFNGENGLPVDNVDGVTPESNQHLFELISGIIN